MATLPQLVEALQPQDGRDKATLTQIGRLLREAGYIPKGKRGAGAPKMTAEHAAFLIIGAYGVESPKDAPAHLERIRRLEPFGPEDEAPVPLFEDVAEAEDFASALAILIDGAAGLILLGTKYAHELTESEIGRHAYFRQIAGGYGPMKVEVIMRENFATILFIGNGTETVWRRDFSVGASQLEDGNFSQRTADRRVQVTFGLPTLIAAYRCIHDDEEELANASS